MQWGSFSVLKQLDSEFLLVPQGRRFFAGMTNGALEMPQLEGLNEPV